MAKGEIAGLRVALVSVLAARGLALTEPHRARLDACEALDTLTLWMTRAAVAADADAVFAA